MIRKKLNKNGTHKWEASVMIKGRKAYRRFDSYEAAEQWVSLIRYKRGGGMRPMLNVTIQMLFDAYIQYAQLKDRAASTIKRARETFKNHLLPFYKNVDMTRVTIEEHDMFFEKMKNKGLKGSTCNRARSLLMVMYSTAVKKRSFGGGFQYNPLKSIEPQQELRRRSDYWNQESIDRFLKSERDSHYYPLWVLLVNTGMRIGEAIALHREQIDLALNQIAVDRTWVETENKVVLTVKGKKIRHVGLNLSVRETLYPILKDAFIFTKPDGSPLTSNYVRKHVLPKACQKAQVKNIGPHGFRHTYSAHYMMKGGSLWDLQKILGHSDTQLTEKYYAHFSSEHIQKRANIVSFGNIIQPDFGQMVA